VLNLPHPAMLECMGRVNQVGQVSYDVNSASCARRNAATASWLSFPFIDPRRAIKLPGERTDGAGRRLA